MCLHSLQAEKYNLILINTFSKPTSKFTSAETNLFVKIDAYMRGVLELLDVTGFKITQSITESQKFLCDDEITLERGIELCYNRAENWLKIYSPNSTVFYLKLLFSVHTGYQLSVSSLFVLELLLGPELHLPKLLFQHKHPEIRHIQLFPAKRSYMSFK